MQHSQQIQNTIYSTYAKRFFDIVMSFLGLIILSPVLLICMLAIKIDDIHGSVFFRQERNGRNGKVFTITKLRTMKETLSGENIAPTVDTLTGIGKALRKLSLDEIPQLKNILTGEMSLIGPRPLLLCYYEWFTETERLRFNVRPGLTGLSQIKGRAHLNWDERFALDVQYVENLSFMLDLKIFFRSFLVVFSHKDALLDDTKIECFDEYRKKKLAQQKEELSALPAKAKAIPYSAEGHLKGSRHSFANSDQSAGNQNTIRKIK